MNENIELMLANVKEIGFISLKCPPIIQTS